MFELMCFFLQTYKHGDKHPLKNNFNGVIHVWDTFSKGPWAPKKKRSSRLSWEDVGLPHPNQKAHHKNWYAYAYMIMIVQDSYDYYYAQGNDSYMINNNDHARTKET